MNNETCNSCGLDLKRHKHYYFLDIGVRSMNHISSGVVGLGTVEIYLCPDCIRNFLELYNITFPNLMNALHAVNQEEQNPV